MSSPLPEPEAMPRRAKRLLPRLVLLLASTLLALVLGESACRFRVHQANRNTLLQALEAPPPLIPGKPATLRSIIRLNMDDRIAYELRPHMSGVSFKGAPLSTNSQGFRSAEVPATADAQAVTIVGLGDSIMFGHGVGDGESYLDLLGERLEKLAPDEEWRIINSAVPGYNTTMEVTTLEQKLLPFGPDLVILGLCANDFAPPNYVRVEADVWDLSRSFLVDALLDRTVIGDEYRQEALSHRGVWNKETGQEDAPARYASLYGREPALAALDRLAELSRQEGFEVLAVLLFETSKSVDGEETPEEALLAACRRSGFHVVRMQDDIMAAVEAEFGQPFSWPLYSKSKLAVSTANDHPSRLLHRMTADRLLAALQESGLLARFTDTR